ncbi:MAG: hypothetical protein K1X57_11580 [Gemmataceae bacterium]|nr:hypothetical protein [Gemmataceae bacterium]
MLRGPGGRFAVDGRSGQGLCPSVMGGYSLGIWAWLFLAPPDVDARFVQIAPPPAVQFDGAAPPRRRPDVQRAIVLFHGLRIQPVSAAAAGRAEPAHWESPDLPAVRTLARDADVYAFHYAQTMPLDDIARLPALARAARSLREAGYDEIVLVGFSVGGVIARQFVEDTPDSGVTKVIQVCAPNGGSDWSVLKNGVREVQLPFVRSLAREERAKAARDRADRTIPANVEFVCVVGAVTWSGDGVVTRGDQWPADLRAQGIPAVKLKVPHVAAMYSTKLAEKLAELSAAHQPRWTPEQVADQRSKVLGPWSVIAWRD